MKVKFLGGVGTVTGSKYLLEISGLKILVDCGLFQGLKDLRLKNWEKVKWNLDEIDAVVLTHAHLDHSGYIPRLVKEGYRGKIYCTKATYDLCRIMLPDSGYLMEEEASYANKKKFSKHKPALPLYTMKDAEDSLERFVSLQLGKSHTIKGEVQVIFKNAGHILGASSITIHNGIQSIGFSGDLGRKNNPIYHDPDAPISADYLLLESTYGNRTHSVTDPLDELAEVINSTIEKAGTVIIPAFAVGRAQQLLYYISELKRLNRIPKTLPIYLNSPMATNVTKLYCEHSSGHKLGTKACEEIFSVATYIRSVEDSIALNQNPFPKVIVSASGMATGGRVVHHIKEMAPNPRNTLVFSGYQAAGTRGEKILAGAKFVKMLGEEVPIKCRVFSMDSMSAHADADELVAWVKSMPKKPKKIFIVHGEPEQSTALKLKIEEELKIEAYIPSLEEEIRL
jgi:metallo-beta-lactamase family protein